MPTQNDFIKNNSLYGLILLLSLGFIWGTGYSIARFAMTNGVSPLGYSFWQSFGPAVIIGIIMLASHKKGFWRSLSLAPWHYYFICGLTGIAIPNTAMYFAAPHLPAGILAMIVNTVPIIVYPLALLLRTEHFSWQRLTGVAAAFIGLMLIIVPQANLNLSSGMPWALITLIAPFSFAICAIYISQFSSSKSDIMAQTFGMLVSSSLILSPLVFGMQDFYTFSLPMTTPDMIILLEIALSSIGYLLFFQLIKTAGAVFYSLVDTIVVLTGLFWGYIIFDECLNQYSILALYFILFALLLVTQHQRSAASLREI